jgi:DNA-binding transcriptional MerR regulator
MPASRKVASPATTHTITELAQEFDITPRAIRFYEDVGLLTPGREGRNRVYTHRDRTRLKLTLRGKRLGLTLLEIKQLVDMYESPDDTATQLHAFLGVLQAHRLQLEQQKDDIEVTLAEIAQHEARCRDLLGTAARRAAGSDGRAEVKAAVERKGKSGSLGSMSDVTLRRPSRAAAPRRLGSRITEEI